MRATHQPRIQLPQWFILPHTLPGKPRKPKLDLRETPPPMSSSRMDGLFPLFIHSRNSGWPTRVFVLPREARQKRRCASCAREVDLPFSRQSRSMLGRKRRNSKSKHLRACQQRGSVTWFSWETFLSHTSVLRQEEELEADTSLVVIGFHKKYCHPECVEDSHDPTEVSYRILAQEAWSGARGLITTQIRRDRWCRSGGQGSERQLREGSSWKRRVRCLLSPLLCQRRRPRVQGCPTPSRIRPPGNANAVGPSILGVVLRGKGLGLRTKEYDFESVVGQVYSEEESKRFIGERWEATNLPLSWSKAAVQAFLAGWPCTVEASFRAGKTRSAIIRSAVPPPHRRLQHDFGCLLIQPAEPRKRQNAQVLVWSKPGKTTVESQKVAKSWASVVRGNPTPPVTAKRPLAGSESMDTTALGAITPTQVQDNNQGPTQVSTLQPTQAPVLADVVPQLQVLMASVQSIATTVGQLGGQLHSLQAEVTVMKHADNEDDEFEEHDGFSSEFGEREGALASQKINSARLTPY